MNSPIIIIIGVVAVLVTVGILKATDTTTAFVDLGEERRHYFVSMHPLGDDRDYVMMCQSHYGEWVETEEKQGCDFRTPFQLDEFKRELVATSGLDK